MFENKIVLEVIDKRTGEVKQRIEEKNAILSLASAELVDYMTTTNVYTSVPRCDTVGLWNTTSSKIKDLPMSWNSTHTDTGTAIQNVGTATDSSSDTYTVNYLQLTKGSVSTWGSGAYFGQKLSSSITKGSTDVLKVTWTISVPYSSPPS